MDLKSICFIGLCLKDFFIDIISGNKLRLLKRNVNLDLQKKCNFIHEQPF